MRFRIGKKKKKSAAADGSWTTASSDPAAAPVAAAGAGGRVLSVASPDHYGTENGTSTTLLHHLLHYRPFAFFSSSCSCLLFN